MTLRPLTIVTTVALLTACGSTTATTATTPAGQTTSATSTTSVASAFPIIVARTGGLAGFDDRVVVARDGATTVTARGAAGTTCRLTAVALAGLESSVRSLVAAAPQASGTPRNRSDALTMTLVTPLRPTPVQLGEGQTPDAAAVNALVADVTGGRPAYTLCTRP